MKKKFLTVGILLIAQIFYAQDSIVNYRNLNNEIVNKKIDANFIETIVKKDSLWLVSTYYLSGKLYQRGFSTSKTPENNLIGDYLFFNKNGNIKQIRKYNEDGKLHGKSKSWFSDGKISHIGLFDEGKQVGVWKYYHNNGKEACRQYFVDGKLMKTVLYNEEGNIENKSLAEFKGPTYKEGMQVFSNRIKRLHEYLNFQVVGKVKLEFDVGVDGKISNVEIAAKLPKKLTKEITMYLESSKDWQPAIHMNRAIPYTYFYTLDFLVKLTE